MSGIFSELFNKIVAAICAVVFIAGVACFAVYTANSVAAEEAKLDAIRAASEPLELEKAMYQRQLNNLEADMIASLPCGSTMTLVITSSSENLYTKLYPLLNATHELCDSETDAALTATICFTPSTLPGAEGCITEEEYQELVEAGWSAALYVSGNNASQIENYLASAKSAFEAKGIELPTVAYFAKNAYSPNYDGALQLYGIGAVFHHEEDGFDLICRDTDSAIWRVGSVDWNTKNVAPSMLTSLLNISGNLAFAFGFSESELNSLFTGDSMANAAVDRMLDIMRQNLLTDDLNIGSAVEGRATYLNYVNEYNDTIPQLEPRKAELRALIADIERRLVMIYSGVLPEDEEGEA